MNSSFTEYSFAHIVMQDQSRNYCLKEWDKPAHLEATGVNINFSAAFKERLDQTHSLAKRLNLGECGFPGFNMCIAVVF